MRLFQRLPLLLLLVATLSLTACDSSDDGGSGGGGNGFGSVTATIGGENFSGSLVTAGTYASNVFAFASSDSSSPSNIRQINVNVVGVTGPGTYSLTGMTGSQGIWSEGASTSSIYSSMFPGGSGSITITELTASRAKGTFSFTGATQTGATRTVSNGEFDISL